MTARNVLTMVGKVREQAQHCRQVLVVVGEAQSGIEGVYNESCTDVRQQSSGCSSRNHGDAVSESCKEALRLIARNRVPSSRDGLRRSASGVSLALSEFVNKAL